MTTNRLAKPTCTRPGCSTCKQIEKLKRRFQRKPQNYGDDLIKVQGALALVVLCIMAAQILILGAIVLGGLVV